MVSLFVRNAIPSPALPSACVSMGVVCVKLDEEENFDRRPHSWLPFPNRLIFKLGYCICLRSRCKQLSSLLLPSQKQVRSKYKTGFH